MEIEKTLFLAAPAPEVWRLLLDPVAMGTCVPGMESIEVVSDDEYLARMKVKISFISARFLLRTRIVEREEPRYLRAEGTGEDASVASSLKQTSEMWLQERDGGTELRIKVRVDVLGRMGTFGLGVMKTKADRLWDEFGVNAGARLAGKTGLPTAAGEADQAVPAATAVTATPNANATAAGLPLVTTTVPAGASRAGWWSRCFGHRSSDTIRVEWIRNDSRIVVEWPAQHADACTAWLRTLA